MLVYHSRYHLYRDVEKMLVYHSRYHLYQKFQESTYERVAAERERAVNDNHNSFIPLMSGVHKMVNDF